jgi:hypothetical protein
MGIYFIRPRRARATPSPNFSHTHARRGEAKNDLNLPTYYCTVQYTRASRKKMCLGSVLVQLLRSAYLL